MVDCINTIKMMTGSPYGELNLANKTNYPSLFDPNSPGFIGFLKMYLQNEGIFGSSEALQKAIDHYSKFFYPPTIYKIQSFGLPILCLDLAALDGNPFIITSVSSEFDKSQNKWWQTVEGEWYGPPAVQN
jgi:hypothetical protein